MQLPSSTQCCAVSSVIFLLLQQSFPYNSVFKPQIPFFRAFLSVCLLRNMVQIFFPLKGFFPYGKFSCSLFPTASSFFIVQSLPQSTFFYHVVFFVSSFFLLFLFAAIIVFFVLRFLICGLKCCCMKTVYYHIIIGLCSKFISKTALFLLQTSTCNFNSPFTLFQPATIFFLLWSLLFFLRQSSPFSCSSRFIPAFFVFHLQFFFHFAFSDLCSLFECIIVQV